MTLKITAINLDHPDRATTDTGGDAFLLEVDGHYAMIDAGGWTKQSGVDLGGNGSPTTMDPDNFSYITSILDAKGITALDFFLITHFHYDHSMAAHEIINNYNPAIVYGQLADYTKLPAVEQSIAASNYWNTKAYQDRVSAALTAKSKSLVLPTEGQQITLGGAKVTFYNTQNLQTAYTYGDYNISAIATLIEYGSKRIFICSDTTPRTMDAITATVGSVDIVFVAHHGINANNSANMAQNLDAKYAVVATTVNPREYQDSNGVHLHRLYLNSLNMFHQSTTLADGKSIEFDTDGTTWTVAGEPSYLLASEWIEDNRVTPSIWYYINSQGYVQTNNFATISGCKYYFGSDSKMKRDWFQDTTGAWYYAAKAATSKYKDGQIYISEWIQAANGTDWFYVDANGKMLANTRVQIGTAYYQFGSDGKMLRGWQLYNNVWYYYSNGSGHLNYYGTQTYADGSSYVNDWVQGNNGYWYWLQADYTMAAGKWVQIQGKGTTNSFWYYFETSGRMYKGWLQHTDGYWYYLSPTSMSSYYKDANFAEGQMHTNNWIQAANGGTNWYWVQSTGKMAVSTTLTINGNQWKFDANGVASEVVTPTTPPPAGTPTGTTSTTTATPPPAPDYKAGPNEVDLADGKVFYISAASDYYNVYGTVEAQLDSACYAKIHLQKLSSTETWVDLDVKGGYAGHDWDSNDRLIVKFSNVVNNAGAYLRLYVEFFNNWDINDPMGVDNSDMWIR